MSFADAIQRAIMKKKLEEMEKQTEAASGIPATGKIIFTGLDNSGKSSIILSLQKKYSQIATLQPTRQTERSSFVYLGNRITRHDLGGQKRYRITYLQDPNRFFAGASACLYTIDVQDVDRWPESLKYFKEILDAFKEVELDPPFYIFLHKADPDWINARKDHHEGTIEDLKEKFQEVVGDKELTFKTTSIFDPWTIVSAFSDVLVELYPKSKLLDSSLQEFAKKIQAEGMVILDEQALIIGQFYDKEQSKVEFEEVTPHVLQLFDSYRITKADLAKLDIIVDTGSFTFRRLSSPFQSDVKYIFFKGPLDQVNEEVLTNFHAVLSDLLTKS